MNQWMQEWIRKIGDFKFLTGMYFMGIVIVYMFIGYFLGEQSISFAMLLQIILTSILGAGMQSVFFESNLLGRYNQKLRVSMHFFGCYILLLALSQIFSWYAIENLSLTLGLTLVYLFLYITLFWAFYIYYKTQGNKYNQKLNEFKQKTNKNK